MKGRSLIMTSLVTVMICIFFWAGNSLAGSEPASHDGGTHSLILSKSVPGQLNYQGQLVNSADSSAVTATLEMTFRLFDSETKGAELWSETHPAVEVTGGLFQVLLGSVTFFPAGLFDGDPMWLQTEVGAEVLSPRKPLSSVAYSQMAGEAGHAATADQASHADTADVCPGISAWIVDGDNVYRTTGQVGIGTASPSFTLDVDGTVGASAFYGDGSNLTGVSGSADADWTIRGDTVYHEVGPVGIGTASPTERLTLYYDSFIGWEYSATNKSVLHKIGKSSSGAGPLEFRTSFNPGPTGELFSFYNEGSAADLISILYNGNVGIGTASPAYPLDVSGAVNATTYYGDGSNLTGISGSADADWTIRGDTVYHEVGPVGIGTASPTAPLTIQGASGDDIYFPGTTNNVDIKSTMSMRIGTDSGHGVGLITNNLYRMLVNGDGDVGIGTTSPQQKLHIHDDAKGLCYTQFTNSSTGGESGDGLIVGINSSGDAFLQNKEADRELSLGTAGVNRIYIKNTGEIGIGTSIPAYDLEVIGSVGATTYYGDGSNLTGISGTTDADWTISGDNMYSAVSGNVGIGTTGPTAKLHVDGGSGYYTQICRSDRAVYGVNTGTNYGYLAGSNGVHGGDIGSGNFGYLGSSGRGAHGEHGSSGNYGYLGSATYAIYGYNGSGNSGYIGGPDYGIYGSHGSSGNYAYLGSSGLAVHGIHQESGNYGTLGSSLIGTHGYNDSTGYYGNLGTNDYGIYYSGGISGTGKGGLIVRTHDGPREMSFHQTTESWCEDFGGSQVYGGRAEIRLADDFLQTVTVSAAHPLKVFITPNQRIGEWWVEKNSAGFVLVAPDAPEGARFDYRIVAKQRGYEYDRLIPAPAGYGDHNLYPDIADVPLEYRERWRQSTPVR